MRIETMPKEYIERENAYDYETLEDWFINSVSNTDSPIWTKEHLKELINDFYVIPKDTPTADVVEVVRCKDCKYHEEDETGVWCSRVFNSHKTVEDNFCKFGAKMDKE